MNIHIIWAQDNNGGIGKNNTLPWHIPEDLMNFKKITSNNTVIMGRKTWESLSKKPLPNRRNIVLSSKKIDDVESYSSIDLCLESLAGDKLGDIFIIGGKMVYNSFYNHADILHITLIDKVIDGIDTYFPISIEEIEKSYQMIEEKELTDNCIYTKWVKESQNNEDSMLQEDEGWWEKNSPDSLANAAEKLIKKTKKRGPDLEQLYANRWYS